MPLGNEKFPPARYTFPPRSETPLMQCTCMQIDAANDMPVSLFMNGVVGLLFDSLYVLTMT